MAKMTKLLTIVGLLFIAIPSSQAMEKGSSSKMLFAQIQSELWIHGIEDMRPETDQRIQEKINNIGRLSATDFYPEELTQPLNKL